MLFGDEDLMKMMGLKVGDKVKMSSGFVYEIKIIYKDLRLEDVNFRKRNVPFENLLYNKFELV